METPERWQLRDVVALVGPELEPQRCRWIAVDRGRISEIATAEPFLGLQAGDRVVLPGLINGHTHIGDTFLAEGATDLSLEAGFFRPNGYKYRELCQVNPDTHIAAMARCLEDMAAMGTVAHLDFREQGKEGVRRLRKAAAAVGVTGYSLSQLNDSSFIEKQLQQNQALLDPAAVAEVQELLDVADGLSESTVNDLTDPAWQQLRAMSDAAGKLRALHCLESPEYRSRSIAVTGRGDLERALEVYDPHLVVHMTVANADEITLLAASGKPVAVNPRANAVLGLPLPPLFALWKAGIPMLLGTDNAMLNRPNLFAEMDFAYRLMRSQAARETSIPPGEVLKMVTTHARCVLGEDAPGVLEVGAQASLLVVDASQRCLQDSQNLVASLVLRMSPEAILATVHNGRWLHRRSDVSL